MATSGRPAKWTMVVALILCGACSPRPEPAAGNDPALADTLRSLIDRAYDFGRSDVVQGMTALYPDSGRVISASDGHLLTSADSVRSGIARFWENVGRNMQNPSWQWGEVHVDRLGADAAVLTGSWRIPHVAPSGNPHTLRGAWTAIFRRVDGEWKIVQEHLSVPPPPEE